MCGGGLYIGIDVVLEVLAGERLLHMGADDGYGGGRGAWRRVLSCKGYLAAYMSGMSAGASCLESGIFGTEVMN